MALSGTPDASHPGYHGASRMCGSSAISALARCARHRLDAFARVNWGGHYGPTPKPGVNAVGSAFVWRVG